jgi:hypothetical protein
MFKVDQVPFACFLQALLDPVRKRHHGDFQSESVFIGPPRLVPSRVLKNVINKKYFT